MLVTDVIHLYETLDFERDSEATLDDPVQLFRRTEGAVVTHELLWILGEPHTHQAAYNRFSLLTQRLVSSNGINRMRLVATSDESLKEFDESYNRYDGYPLHGGVYKDSWTSLLNSLFGSEKFCAEVVKRYDRYRNNLSVQLQSATGITHASWSYSPQSLERSRGDRIPFASFLEDVVPTSDQRPKLFVIHAPASYGKTAFSYAASYELANRHYEHKQAPFPIFIPFEGYRRFGGVRDILRAELENLQLYGVNSQSLLRLIHWGRAIIVLDGFDELIAEAGIETARDNLRALQELLHGSARLLLTTRSAFLSTHAEVLDILETDDRENVEILELAAFDRNAQKEYLESIGLSQPEVRQTQRYLDSFPQAPTSGERISVSPLLLNIVAHLANNVTDNSFPNLNELYDLYVNRLCDRERERQNHSIDNALQMDILSKLAMSMYQDKTLRYDADVLDLFWEEAKDLMLSRPMEWEQRSGEDPDPYKAKLLSHALLNSAGESNPLDREGQVGFIHPSFREHFVSSHIRRSIARGAVPEDIRSCITRSISDGLAEMLSYRVDDLEQCLKLLLENKGSGFRNALRVLVSAVQQRSIQPSDAESVLATALGGREIQHVNLSGLRLEALDFRGWVFRSCDFNRAQLVSCNFINCNFNTSSMFGTTIIDSNLSGSDFGDARLVNSLGVIQDDQVDRLYDNREIRLWLYSESAEVHLEGLDIVTDDPIPGNQLLEHIFRKFYPRGSETQQRHILRTSITRSLPSHRVASVNQLSAWLERERVLLPGPPLRRHQTLEISPAWRDDITAWMREEKVSPRLQKLIAQSPEE